MLLVARLLILLLLDLLVLWELLVQLQLLRRCLPLGALLLLLLLLLLLTVLVGGELTFDGHWAKHLVRPCADERPETWILVVRQRETREMA